MKTIPIGISDFKRLYNEDCYYVDKTLMIKDLLDNKTLVSLFTRPRRFGKTLNMSMIKYFFEKTDEDNSYLFKNLNIWKEGDKYTKHQGKYPVINLTFKDAKMRTWEETYIELTKIISLEYKRHAYLEDIIQNEHDKLIFNNIKDNKARFSDYSTAIKILCVYLERYHKQKPIILIDEYDVPIQNSYINGFYDDAINFIRAMLQNALKDNSNLEFAVMTGCLRISKESIFTGLNNLVVISILDYHYSEHFGFTPKELDEMLKYYNIEDAKPIIKEWYNGYKFGDRDIYNPWSVLNYIKNALLNGKENAVKTYWANTSGNDVVRKLIKKANSNTKAELETLLAGGSIIKRINENITYIDIDSSLDNIWNMLYFTGYLTTVEGYNFLKTNRLRIPNKEIRTLYETEIKTWFDDLIAVNYLENISKSLLESNEEMLSDEINQLLANSISYHDANENFYHGFLLGVLQSVNGYNIKSNRENGDGRSDIILEPLSPKHPAIIIEIKRSLKINELDKKCEEALNQIDINHYDTELVNEGYDNIIKYGIAFFKKMCAVKVKVQ